MFLPRAYARTRAFSMCVCALQAIAPAKGGGCVALVTRKGMTKALESKEIMKSCAVLRGMPSYAWVTKPL